MGQRCQLLGALLLQPPLAAQAVGQLAAHRLHGVQRVGKFADAAAVGVHSIGMVGGDLRNGAVQPGGVGSQPPHRACCCQRRPAQQQDDQKQNVAGLKIRQPAAQRFVGVGQGVIIRQNTKAAVRHFYVVLVLGISQVAAAAVKGVQGNFQLPGGHIGSRYSVVFHNRPAAKVADLRFVKGVGGHGDHRLPCVVAGFGTGSGRQQKPVADQRHQQRPPDQHQQGASAAAEHQIPHQHAVQGGQPSFCHTYPTPHTVLMMPSAFGSPAARSLARIFLICWVTAVSSALPS